MRRFKKLLRSDAVREALCWAAAKYISLVRYTGRWEMVGAENVAPYWDRGESFIAAFWHGRILMMPYSWRRGVPIRMLISSHRDGLIIARTVSYFGIDTVAGSTSKGGSAALRTMLKSLKTGICVGITPDGPRGPMMRASEGIVQVARMSGKPVFPCTYSAARRRLMGSWDQFMVAWPFSRGVFEWGRPIFVPADASPEQMEAARLAIEEAMNALAADADARVGRAPITPAPLQPQESAP